MSIRRIDAASLLGSPAHAALVSRDDSLGSRASLDTVRRELEVARHQMEALKSTASWRIGNALVRSARGSALAVPRTARAVLRVVLTKVVR